MGLSLTYELRLPPNTPRIRVAALLTALHERATADEWFWWCACKTQYASAVSNEHFVAVHTSLVMILDAAAELGFDVTVNDETGYWESRSPVAPLESLASMNRFIARFAGRLSDALGDEHDVQAAIFQHPRFERLEMGE